MMTNLVGPVASSRVGVSFNDAFWSSVVLLAEYRAPTDLGPAAKAFQFYRIPTIAASPYGNSLHLESTDPTTAANNRVCLHTSSNDTDFTMGSSDFCCEILLARSSEPTIQENFFSRWWTLNDRRSYRGYYNPTNDSITFEVSTNGTAVTQTARFILGTDGVSLATFFDGNFHHVALVRNGTEIAVYVDGYKGSVTGNVSTTALFSPANANDRFVIGALHTNISTSRYFQQGWTGKIDEVRVTKGVPRYTAAFTPSLPHPRNSTDDANWSSVLCLFGFNTFTQPFEAGTYFTGISKRSYSAISTDDLGLIGADGIGLSTSGSILHYSADSAFHLGSGDFTIEYFGVLAGNNDKNYLGLYGAINGSRCWRVGMCTNGKPRFQYSTDGLSGTVVTLDATGGSTITGSRVNFCVERSGSTLRMYRNGEMLYKNTSFTATIFNPTDAVPLAVAHQRGATGTPSGASDEPFRGFRITKGAARYASDSGYTVPSLPLPRA